MNKVVILIVAMLFLSPMIPAFMADSPERMRDVFISLGLLAISLLLLLALYETILKPNK